MKNRYLVAAFYKNLGIKMRMTGYSKKKEAYEYIGALRFCDTPYCAVDMKKNVIFDIDDSKISRAKMAEMMTEQFEMDEKEENERRRKE